MPSPPPLGDGSDCIGSCRRCRLLLGGSGPAAFAVGALTAGVDGLSAPLGAAAPFTVSLGTPDGAQEFVCLVLVYVLDQTEEEGLGSPVSCPACMLFCRAGKVLSGSIDQSVPALWCEDLVGECFCLTCVSYPTSVMCSWMHCYVVCSPGPAPPSRGPRRAPPDVQAQR